MKAVRYLVGGLALAAVCGLAVPAAHAVPPKASVQEAVVPAMAAQDFTAGSGATATAIIRITFAGGKAGATGTRRAQQFYFAWDTTTPPTFAFFGPGAHADTTSWIPYGGTSISLGVLIDSVQVTPPSSMNYSWWANTVRVVN